MDRSKADITFPSLRLLSLQMYQRRSIGLAADLPSGLWDPRCDLLVEFIVAREKKNISVPVKTTHVHTGGILIGQTAALFTRTLHKPVTRVLVPVHRVCTL